MTQIISDCARECVALMGPYLKRGDYHGAFLVAQRAINLSNNIAIEAVISKINEWRGDHGDGDWEPEDLKTLKVNI